MQKHHTTATNNRGLILDKLKSSIGSLTPPLRSFLEVSSGTGAHMELFAQEYPHVTFQPTEYVEPIGDEDPFAAHGKIGEIGSDPLKTLNENLFEYKNVAKASALDLTRPDLFVVEPGMYDVVHCGNTIHVSPFPSATDGLMHIAAKALKSGGLFTLYGPFKRHGAFTTPSNADFDKYLKDKNPAFGLRDLESDIVPRAKAAGLKLEKVEDMPANNFFVLFSKL